MITDAQLEEWSKDPGHGIYWRGRAKQLIEELQRARTLIRDARRLERKRCHKAICDAFEKDEDIAAIDVIASMTDEEP